MSRIAVIEARDRIAGLPQGQFNDGVNLHPLFGLPILVAFNGADAAQDLAARPGEEVINRAMQVLNRAYPH